MGLVRNIKRIFTRYLDAVKKLKINRLKAYILFFHYVFCKRKYRCKVEEYFAYEFYKISHKKRSQFLLAYHQRNMYKLINRKGATSSKVAVAEKFPLQFGRDVLHLEACPYVKFAEFFQKHLRIIIKPDDASYGRDVQMFDYQDVSQSFQIFSRYTGKNYICEEYIRQHPDLNKLNPHSVNTIRILALLEDGEVSIIAAALRTGSGDDVVDNLKHGGIGANINIETGIVDTDGKNYLGETFFAHPNTGCPFKGLKIPYWNEAISMIRDIHPKFSHCALLGWDVAITAEKPIIVETNNAPGPMIHQFIDKVPRGEKIIDFMNKKKIIVEAAEK